MPQNNCIDSGSIKSWYPLFSTDSQLWTDFSTKLKCAFGISDENHNEIVQEIFSHYGHDDFKKVKWKQFFRSVTL